MQFHHIGLVVPNLQTSLGEITQFLPFQEISLPAEVESQKVKVCFLKMGDSAIELIEPMTDDSPVAEFARKGGGIHHLCFEVEDIHQSIEKLTAEGAIVVTPPVIGFEGRLIAFLFLRMKHTNCNLIELAERRSSGSPE
ncbi:MAG: VOC family protein [Bacteroidetes bacterium]|nr:VOC family protein [Bacteroidota bacterium]